MNKRKETREDDCSQQREGSEEAAHGFDECGMRLCYFLLMGFYGANLKTFTVRNAVSERKEKR